MSRTPAVKLVVNNGKPIMTPVASDEGKMEYFAILMEGASVVKAYGPFPSQRAAEDAVNEWYADGEWYITTKVKVMHKGRKH